MSNKNKVAICLQLIEGQIFGYLFIFSEFESFCFHYQINSFNCHRRFYLIRGEETNKSYHLFQCSFRAKPIIEFPENDSRPPDGGIYIGNRVVDSSRQMIGLQIRKESEGTFSGSRALRTYIGLVKVAYGELESHPRFAKTWSIANFFPACETLTRFFRRATFTGDKKLLPYASRFDAISLAAL